MVVELPSVGVEMVGTGAMHILVGAPEQTRPPVHMPGEPALTAVNTQAPAAEQLSVVHALLSLQCEAVVQATQVAAPPVPTQKGVAAVQPMSVPVAEVSMQAATTKLRTGEAGLVTPERVCVVVMAWGPAAIGAVGVHV